MGHSFVIFCPFCVVVSCFYLLMFATSDGSQYCSVPDGMFRKPLEGQSLISYLSEQDFGSCADLEKVGGFVQYDSIIKTQIC